MGEVDTQGTAAPEGLLHALLLDGEGGCRPLAWHEVVSWQPEQGCMWLHFHFEEPSTQAWLAQESGLIDVAVNGLLAAETRPRTVTRGDNLLMAVRGINLNPGADPEDMVSVRLWSNGRKLISTRRRKLLPTEDLLASLAEGDGPRNATELLVGWLDRIVARMSDLVDSFEDRVLELEQQLLAGELKTLRQDLGQLRKETIVVRRYLAPQREAFNRLIGEALSWVDELNRLRLREVSDRLIRYIEDIDAVRERAALAQDELVGRISEQMNERMYLLSMIAAMFLPLGFFTGLMGINVGGMPGIDSGIAFWAIVGLCLVIALLLFLLFRWKRWL